MKKCVSALLLALSVLYIPIVFSAGDSGIIGHIYSTNILAYIGSCPIDSYNIGGKTVIIVEDLGAPGYGHHYTYNDEERLLAVDSGFSKPWGKFAEIPRGQTGKILGNVYRTDIRVTYNGTPVTGYNIGGRTAICIEELGDLSDSPHPDSGYSKYFAYHVWDEENRTVTLNTFGSNESSITGLALSRAFYTFADNVLYVHPDDTKVYASIEPSKNGVPLPDNVHEEGYSTYWFSEGFENETVQPLYLQTGDTRAVIGSVVTVPQPEIEVTRTYLHIDNPEEVLAYAKSVRTPTSSYEDAMAYLAGAYTEVKRLTIGNYTVLHMKDENGTDLVYAVKDSGGLLLIDRYGDDNAAKNRVVDIVSDAKDGENTVSVTLYPYTDNHGKTVTMSGIHHLDTLSFD